MTSSTKKYGSIDNTEDDQRRTSAHDEDRRRSMSTSSSSHRVDSTRFLHAVKAVQIANRMEKLVKMKSESALLLLPTARATGANTAAAAADPSWHSDLTTDSFLPSTAEVPGGEEASGDDDNNNEIITTTNPTLLQHLMQICFGKGVISWGLAAGPLALLANHWQWSDTAKFWLNFIVMIPLASILGDFTEEVALHTNETIGGLINATFGNAVEVVVAIQALLANEIRVVQSSMLGSIFSNLLLVLGGCFFFGGLKYPNQSFNATAATANMGLLALSAIALVLPTPFAHYYDMHDDRVLLISRFSAIFLMFMYAQLLVFQLHTHANAFTAEGGEDGKELANMSFGMGILGLLVCTLLVTIFSDYLVESIDGFTTASGISRTFVGIVLLPIVGNAVEHVTAITVARKDKMDLAMGIAVGSCTQISLFVVPLTVLVGWAVDRDMNLNFPHFEVILFVLSIFTVSVVLGNPSSHWLEGSLLMTTYVLIGVGFWFEDVKAYSSTSSGGSVGEL
uniref:Sodium/calcium exchanger membrane region domain-containing protein n=1 Tax=Amphora coffeiformis TaxID=265554 RepID=A0A7S3KYE4_9STRA